MWTVKVEGRVGRAQGGQEVLESMWGQGEVVEGDYGFGEEGCCSRSQ